jgi:equilibrative nucleoside transporter 1/2/3
MDRVKKLFASSPEQEYEALQASETEGDGQQRIIRKKPGFSHVEYSIFLLLGISMLWAWNMFLAAGPYFQHRFRANKNIFTNFQAAEITVSTVTNLGSMLVLTKLQAGASYPSRIVASLLINMAVFALLAASTAVDCSAEVYFGFLMAMIFCGSLATGLCQNGVFAYASSFGEPKFTQAIMTGQAVAGVLPCIAQIASVLAVRHPAHEREDGGTAPDGLPSPPAGPPPVNWKAALAYFLTATLISVITLLAFSYLLARTRTKPVTLSSDDSNTPDLSASTASLRKPTGLLTLLRKLFPLASAVFVTFAVTMFFPVLTQRILSVRAPADQPPLLQPPAFIPLALLFWNVGDLAGRLLTAVPSLSLVLRPRLVLILALLRIGWVGLYHLCNLDGLGASVSSDFFYLVIVQFGFGISNGFLGSTCMMGAGEWVDEDEREAAGGFMSLCLVGGLAVGSVLSFFLT